MRVDWKEYGDKLLRSYGIKDDAGGELWLDEEQVQKAQQSQQQAEKQQLQQQEQLRQKERLESREDYKFKKEVDTEAEIVEKQAEASIEAMTGSKVA